MKRVATGLLLFSQAASGQPWTVPTIPMPKIDKTNYKQYICDAGLFTTVSFTPTDPNYWEGNLLDTRRRVFADKDYYCMARASYEEALARGESQANIDKKGVLYAEICARLKNTKETLKLGWNKAMETITGCGNGFLPYCKPDSDENETLVNTTAGP